MIIGIDGNEANVEKKVGISEYAFELLWQFKNVQYPIFNIQFQIYLKTVPRDELPKESENWKYKIVKPAKLWTQLGLPFSLFFSKPRPDVFFSPTHYAPRFCPVKTAISIMDLSFIYYPEMFKKSDLYQLKNWTAYSAKKANKIFTISQASKNDIIKIYQIPEEKVVVTYPGIKMESSKFNPPIGGQSSKFLEQKYGIDGNYILFVGTLQPRKNIARLIEAFSITLKNADQDAKKPRKSLQLVIIGKKGWLYEEILEASKKFNIENSVKFLDFVPDEDLPSFYSNALYFILPSLYEGFGLPVLEAMKNGCPVITSSVSSLPEAGGNAALYVNPEDVEDIASKMKLLLDDERKRKEMIKKGYEQIKKFSWEKTAKQTLEVLEEMRKK